MPQGLSLIHILTLDAEGRDAVTGDLGQQGTADALDAEGEACVLDGAGVAQIAEHGQEAGSLFLIQPVQQFGDVGVGVAAVSYTHLDVYKRQPSAAARAG